MRLLNPLNCGMISRRERTKASVYHVYWSTSRNSATQLISGDLASATPVKPTRSLVRLIYLWSKCFSLSRSKGKPHGVRSGTAEGDESLEVAVRPIHSVEPQTLKEPRDDKTSKQPTCRQSCGVDIRDDAFSPIGATPVKDEAVARRILVGVEGRGDQPIRQLAPAETQEIDRSESSVQLERCIAVKVPPRPLPGARLRIKAP